MSSVFYPLLPYHQTTRKCLAALLLILLLKPKLPLKNTLVHVLNNANVQATANAALVHRISPNVPVQLPSAHVRENVIASIVPRKLLTLVFVQRNASVLEHATVAPVKRITPNVLVQLHSVPVRAAVSVPTVQRSLVTTANKNALKMAKTARTASVNCLLFNCQ